MKTFTKNEEPVTVHNYCVLIHPKTKEALALAEHMIDTKMPQGWSEVGATLDIGWTCACEDYENFVELAQVHQYPRGRVYLRIITQAEHESYEEMQVMPIMRLSAKLRAKRDNVLWMKENPDYER